MMVKSAYADIANSAMLASCRFDDITSGAFIFLHINYLIEIFFELLVVFISVVLMNNSCTEIACLGINRYNFCVIIT